MLNLIKMDLCRMFHSLSTWLILLFTVGAAFFCVAMVNIDLEAMEEDPSYAQEMFDETAPAESSAEDLQIGLYAVTDPAWVNGDINTGELISTQMQSGILTLLCVIFTAVFVNAEQKNGYIKNIAGQLRNRGFLAVSKLAASALQVFLIMAVFTLSTVLAGQIFWGGRLAAGSAADLLSFLGAQYLLNLGFCALILLLSILTKSSAFSMTAGIIMVLGVLYSVYALISRAVNELLPVNDFNLSLYMLEANIQMTGIGASSDTMQRAVIVGAAFLAVSVISAMAIMKKRDIR